MGAAVATGLVGRGRENGSVGEQMGGLCSARQLTAVACWGEPWGGGVSYAVG